MNIEDSEKQMQSISDFLKYHKDVLESQPYEKYLTAVISVDVGAFGASIHLNDEAFDRVIQNPKIVFDYGCDPLGVTVVAVSPKSMQCSFVWNDVTVLCVRPLDASKITDNLSENMEAS